jgi:TonB family protein
MSNVGVQSSNAEMRMTNRIVIVVCFLAATLCASLAAQTEPTLVTVNIPKYPSLASQARIQGVVKLTFTLLANAEEPTGIEVVSGHPVLKEAAIANVKTWKFATPHAVEGKYETTFRYRLSDHPIRATVTFDSFHEVDVSIAPPELNTQSDR